MLTPVTSSALAVQIAPSRYERNARQATAVSTASSVTSRDRKKSWWVLQCFFETHDEAGEKYYVCRACSIQRSDKNTASRLADHVWDCVKVDEDVKKRLYETCSHIHNRVKRYSGGAQELSELAPVNSRKRRREGTAPRLIENCSQIEADEISMFIVRAAVDFCLPFTLFESSKPQPNFLRRAFAAARPGYADQFPSRHTVMVKYLTKLYTNTKSAFHRSLEQTLSRGFGAVNFDGWDDITMSSVVKVLIRIESNSIRKTFFLDSVFTEHTRLGASEYVRIVEQVMGNFGGLRRICGVASGSARACVNARNALAEKYGGLIGIQDQGHVSDLMMKDIGKLPFVKNVLDKVNFLVIETRSKRKLLCT